MKENKNKIIQGDCLEEMNNIPDGSIDMILTDPRYGMDYQSNRRTVQKKFSKFSNDKDLGWLDNFIEDCFRVLKDNTAIYMFCSWHNIDIFKQSLERHFKLKNIIVWEKNNHGSGDLKGAYAPKHEFVLYAHKGRSLFREKRIPDVMKFDKIHSSKLLHPTEKNIDMLSVFVKNNSDEGQTILDPFAGSGTTGVACQNLNRNYILIEKEPEYIEIIKQRLL